MGKKRIPNKGHYPPYLERRADRVTKKGLTENEFKAAKILWDQTLFKNNIFPYDSKKMNKDIEDGIFYLMAKNYIIPFTFTMGPRNPHTRKIVTVYNDRFLEDFLSILGDSYVGEFLEEGHIHKGRYKDFDYKKAEPEYEKRWLKGRAYMGRIYNRELLKGEMDLIYALIYILNDRRKLNVRKLKRNEKIALRAWIKEGCMEIKKDGRVLVTKEFYIFMNFLAVLYRPSGYGFPIMMMPDGHLIKTIPKSEEYFDFMEIVETYYETDFSFDKIIERLAGGFY